MAVLYRKYRPLVFDEVVGQEHVVDTLKGAITLDRLSHAYLFCGPRGVGKTTVARILAKAVNCLDVKKRPCGTCQNCLDITTGRFIDLIEIDAASNRGIDEIRELRDKIKFTPTIGKKKVYIIDEVHMLTREAFNALLKTLEEPPEHSIFVFATTEAHKVPQTIISRCQRFDFFLGTDDKVKENLRAVARKEGIKIDDDILDLLVKLSGGSYRDGQTLLNQLTPALAEEGFGLQGALNLLRLAGEKEVGEFKDILKRSPAKQALDFVDGLIVRGINLEEFLSRLIVSLRADLIKEVSAGLDTAWHARTIQRLSRSFAEIKLSPIDSLPLELAAIDICPAGGLADEATQAKSAKSNPGGKEPSKAPANPPSATGSPRADRRSSGKRGASFPATDFSSDQKTAVIEAISAKNRPLGALLSAARWDVGKGSVLIKVSYSLYRDKIMSSSSRCLIEEQIEGVLGYSLPVECAVEPAPEDDSPDDLSGEIKSVFEVI